MSSGTRSLSASRNGQGVTAGALSGFDRGACGTPADGRGVSSPAAHESRPAEADAVTPSSFVDATTAASAVREGRAVVAARAGSAFASVVLASETEARLKGRLAEAVVTAAG